MTLFTILFFFPPTRVLLCRPWVRKRAILSVREFYINRVGFVFLTTSDRLTSQEIGSRIVQYVIN